MPDHMRDQLDLAARKRMKRKPGWNLSQEILHRIRYSLDKEREDRRNQVVRDVCFLISEMARRELYTDHRFEDQLWHRDPFMFAAFKLAVARLLDALEPGGQIRPPHDRFGSLFAQFKTPESLADHASRKELHRLFHEKPFTQAERAMALEGAERSVWRGTEYDPFLLLNEFEEPLRAYPNVRHHLGISEPKEPQP